MAVGQGGKVLSENALFPAWFDLVRLYGERVPSPAWQNTITLVGACRKKNHLTLLHSSQK